MILTEVSGRKKMYVRFSKVERSEDRESRALFLFSLRKPAENGYRNEIHSERFLKKIGTPLILERKQ